MEKLIIGITDCSKYANYHRWIAAAPLDIEIVKLSVQYPDWKSFDTCAGIVFSGGEDVHPSFYKKPEYIDYCYPEDVSYTRDEIEWKMMEKVNQRGIPVLGICRGLQFINVFYGGTLIPDLATWGKFNHSKLPDGADRYHDVYIDPQSSLYVQTRLEKGRINSNHHQSADRIGKGLVVSAMSPEGTVEAIEWKHPEDQFYLSLVQWHPERMDDQGSPLVEYIRRDFLDAAVQVK